MNDLEIRVVIGIPGKDRHVQESAEKASTQDSSVFEKLEGNVGNFGIPLLPGSKPKEADNTENDHSNDVVGLPAVGRSRGDVEGGQDQREASNGKDHANNVELHKVVLS